MFHLNPVDALPSCLRPSLILYSHLRQISPSGPIWSQIPTKIVSAFPCFSVHATFNAKEICLDFLSHSIWMIIPIMNFSIMEFYSASCYFLLIGSTHPPLHPILGHPKLSIHPWISDSKFHTHITQNQKHYLLPVFQFLGLLTIGGKDKTFSLKKTNIPWIQSALNLFQNPILIC